MKRQARAVLVTRVAVAFLLLASPFAGIGAPIDRARATGPSAAPAFAYYYIWYSQTSWSRAKKDLPLLGAYDSGDRKVIAQHVSWAKQAGIAGFIVSWKHDPRLDGPLQTLVAEANRQDFRLILLYEGLNFSRKPIGAARVGQDLAWFLQHYGQNAAFTMFGKPVIVWSGTWEYTNQEIASVRTQIGAPRRATLLGSEKSADAYAGRSSLLDGDAYYWSSADPTQTPGYRSRLNEIATRVTNDGGLWIAPVTPGFDARLVGGSSVVDRRDGDTYRASWAAAAAEHPTILGIISWNEYSENSQIEPSESFGQLYLNITRSLVARPSASPTDVLLPGPAVNPGQVAGDSSEQGRSMGFIEIVLAGVCSLAVLGLIVAAAIRARAVSRHRDVR